MIKNNNGIMIIDKEYLILEINFFPFLQSLKTKKIKILYISDGKIIKK